MDWIGEWMVVGWSTMDCDHIYFCIERRRLYMCYAWESGVLYVCFACSTFLLTGFQECFVLSFIDYGFIGQVQDLSGMHDWVMKCFVFQRLFIFVLM